MVYGNGSINNNLDKRKKIRTLLTFFTSEAFLVGFYLEKTVENIQTTSNQRYLFLKEPGSGSSTTLGSVPQGEYTLEDVTQEREVCPSCIVPPPIERCVILCLLMNKRKKNA